MLARARGCGVGIRLSSFRHSSSNLTTTFGNRFGGNFERGPSATPLIRGAGARMWSVGNKSSFISATTDAKAGLAKGLERATAAIAKAPVHDWKRAEVDDGKNHWIVSGDAPRGGGLGDRGPASSALDAHIELEQAMAASRKRVSAPGEASDSSAYDSSSSSSSSASCRRKEKKEKEKKGKGSKKSSSRKDDKRKKSKKRKDRKKDEKRRKRRRAERSSSSSDSETDKQARVSAVSGKKLKLKLEGSNARSAEEERRRRENLHKLNATVDLRVMER